MTSEGPSGDGPCGPSFGGPFGKSALSIFGASKVKAPSKPLDKMDLAELFIHYGSDKDRNGYTQCYHAILNHLRDSEVSLLEIGIGTMIPGAHSSMVGYALEGYEPGGSLRAWAQYFPKGQIVGVDIQPDTQFTNVDRVRTFLCDSTDVTSTNVFKQKLEGQQFDVIVDDGSHWDTAQLKTLSNLYPLLKEGGYYIIEDIYPGSGVSVNPKQVDDIVGGDPFFFVGVKNNICVIHKSHINSKRENY